MRDHWPIWRTALAASAPLVLVIWIHGASTVAFSLTALAWLLAGALYTQLVEYWCHRVPMHRGLPYLRHVRLNHLEHHAIFHGASYQTKNVEDLKHIAGRFWVFPVLFIVHYGALVLVLDPPALIAFMSGTVLHYLTFEVTHYLSHIEDNPVDRFLERIPVVGDMRAYQIEHHRIHHEIPEIAFNFNPPYLGDRLAGHMPSLDAVPVPFEPTPIVALEPVVEAPVHDWRRVIRYGSAAAAGLAIVGAVLVAHGLLTHGKRELVSSPEQTA